MFGVRHWFLVARKQMRSQKIVLTYLGCVKDWTEARHWPVSSNSELGESGRHFFNIVKANEQCCHLGQKITTEVNKGVPKSWRNVREFLKENRPHKNHGVLGNWESPLCSGQVACLEETWDGSKLLLLADTSDQYKQEGKAMADWKWPA